MKHFLLAASIFVPMSLTLTGAHAQESIAECEALIVANRDFAILKGKLNLLNPADQPTEILGNTKKPSKTEKVAIAKWVEEHKKCSKPAIELHKSRSIEVGTMFEYAYADLYLSAADLYQGKITYGDFARGSVKRHQEVRERIAAIVAKTQEQLLRQKAEKEQLEAAERQAEADREQEKLAIRQEQCMQLRQQILQSQMAGPTPDQVRQQQYADAQKRSIDWAKLTPMERANAVGHQSGHDLMSIFAPALGIKNQAVERAQQRLAFQNQQIEFFKRECEQ